MIILRDALKLQIPRVLFSFQWAKPRGMKNAVVFLHGLLNRQRVSIYHKSYIVAKGIALENATFSSQLISRKICTNKFIPIVNLVNHKEI